jgi:serine/threonine protein kinase
MVQAEVSIPAPAHPRKVIRKDIGDMYFFKPVTADQPDAVGREIRILRKLEKLNLEVKAPRLLGFVAYGNSKTETMGLLLENIEAPILLTKLLSSSIPEEQRLEWSRTCETYIKTLHEHEIVWGDAKADNFIVDASSSLWIIDFAGSYTEGWVDPRLVRRLRVMIWGSRRCRLRLRVRTRTLLIWGWWRTRKREG